MRKFTEQQINDWRDYERVRRSAKWNMFDPRARHATGLSKEAYRFVMKIYSELKAESESGK